MCFKKLLQYFNTEAKNMIKKSREYLTRKKSSNNLKCKNRQLLIAENIDLTSSIETFLNMFRYKQSNKYAY